MGEQNTYRHPTRRVVEKIATATLLIGGIGILGSMFLGAADVFGTKFLNWPIPSLQAQNKTISSGKSLILYEKQTATTSFLLPCALLFRHR